MINKYIKSDSIEKRDFQINIARSASNKNTLVVLPTGLGKTIIALLLIANELEKKDKKILFLAPTKPLVIQHASFLKENLVIEHEQINVFTGEVSPEKRRQIWNKSRIIISTPQVIENDLLSKRINLKEVSFIIFDEAHHAVGEYSYVFVSEMFQKHSETGKILGMTASPGNDLDKILDVCKNLNITNIEIRTKYDSDVKPYVHDIKIIWKEIPLPKDFALIIQLLRKALSQRLKKLKDIGVIDTSSVSLINRTKLLEAQSRIQKEIKSQTKPSSELFKAASLQSEAMKINHAIDLIQTQGVNSLKNYLQRMGKEASSKDSSKASRKIMSDDTILEAIAYLKSITIEHPKINEIVEIVNKQIREKKDSKIIIFTHYRDTSAYIVKTLQNQKNIFPVRFIGQSKKDDDKGLTQKEQVNIIKKFKEDKYNVLIATSVAEEGLDIPSTDLVVFFEPIPSEIRAIQRRGRTGRKMSGKVIILITKGTPDEGYYWASKRKEKNMRKELDLIRSKLNKRFEEPKSLFDLKFNNKKDQRSLKDFNKKNTPKIIVDYREYRSNVVKNLTINGVSIEPKQLDVGDYILSSRIGVERKEVDDYLDSLMSGKLFKQISNLREAYSRPILVLEGENLLTRRNINHNAIFGSLASISVDFGIPVLRTNDSKETASLLNTIAKREQKEDKKYIAIRGDKTQMSMKERQQFVIEGLPNISTVLAKRLLNHFGNIKNIANASEKDLMEVEGIGKNIASDIISVLNKDYLE